MIRWNYEKQFKVLRFEINAHDFRKNIVGICFFRNESLWICVRDVEKFIKTIELACIFL